MHKKMSNARFRTIIISIIAILVAFATIATQTALTFSASLDFALGRGERHIENLGNTDPSDAVYYDSDYATAQESQLAAAKLVKSVVEEGAVLLKNRNDFLPLSAGAAVTPIGFHYLDPFFGGSGSAKTDTSAEYIVTPEEALSGHFAVNDTVVSRMKGAEPEIMVYDDGNDDTNLSEFNVSVYAGAEASCQGTTAIVFLGRSGMEGFDANSRVPYEDGTETQMDITVNEKKMIEFAKANCDHVVVILNSASQLPVGFLQDDDEIDAILWVGLPGATGFEAMAEILDGTVNPSGKTVEIWYADFKSDPTYINRISTAYTNAVEGGPNGFIEYEEGIYMGYRYYETRYAEDNSFPVFGAARGYDEAVVYPFGFGLNYEDDKVTQALDSVSESGGTVTVKGTVTNASSRDVKEVVQIYYGAPYTRGGIEKSAKERAAFTKVEVKAGQSQSFTVTFALEDMASYDYQKLYSDNGSYVLESGTYEIFLGKDSHNSWGSQTVSVPETLVYADNAKSGQAVGRRSSDAQTAENLLDDMNAYPRENGMTIMSRSDFAGTFPQAPQEKAASAKVVADIQKFDYLTDPLLGEVEGSILYRTENPTSNANNGISLASLRGLSYDDPRWDDLLDNLDYTSADISEVITHALYQTARLESIGKVETTDHDGTTGLTATWGGNDALAAMFGLTSAAVEAACSYPCGSIQAATWNTELLEEMGEMIGAESLTNNVNGWYAPGLNLHRTPYGGRNFEYYSEDPVLSGYAAAAVVSGAFTKGGLTAYLKHFALNETDDNRAGVAVWADEQTCRQLYFKAFEICVKYASGTEVYYNTDTGRQETITVNPCRAIMTSMNYIGAESPTNSYTLLTELFRNEWSFEGMVLTDFTSGTYKRPDIGYRLGNDLWMGMRTVELDMSTPTARWAARNAIHNIAYVVVNSNAYNNVLGDARVYYDMSPWQKALIAADITIGVICAIGVIWIVLRQNDEKKNPSKYRH